MTKKTKPPEKVRADWEAIERDYRTTNLSNAEIARKHGDVVSAQRIGQKAKAEGWAKDLTEAVRHATQAKVIKAEVKRRQDAGVSEELSAKVSKAFTETANAVDVAAELGAAVVLRHRDDAKSLRDLTMAMRNELIAASLDQDKLQELFLVLGADMDEKQLQAARRRFEDLLRLHSRVGSMHKLADTLAKLQALERKAFNLDDDEGNKKANGDSFWRELAEEVAAAEKGAA